MAKSSSLELDFFSKEKGSINPLPPPAAAPVFQRRRSFRDMQGVITKMNPEVVKSVIGNGSIGSKKSSSVSVPSSPANFSPLPVVDPKLSLRCGGEGDENGEKKAPMTIFYNGMVSVFDVSPRKAQDIMKVAEEILHKSAENVESNSYGERNLLESLNGDLPISRKNSLQRFLEKRKERLITVSPYDFPTNGRCGSQAN